MRVPSSGLRFRLAQRQFAQALKRLFAFFKISGKLGILCAQCCDIALNRRPGQNQLNQAARSLPGDDAMVPPSAGYRARRSRQLASRPCLAAIAIAA